ncbi:fungal-specific transcription factor domain-containing protein [Phellopilus nigrolimitatus]|nr:fungal-specific transcription factor domain-containing protein [Phellopilus nigrolimitatus]
MPPAAKNDIDASGLELRRVRVRELELKRTRGEISCAECRRLKLRCDKKVPCSSCTRRGCSAVCPTGINSAGSPAARLILASDTDHVQHKLTSMSERIRALEDALQIESAAGSRGLAFHPLLAPDLLAIKQGVDVPRPVEEEEEEMAGAFGTLSVSEGTSMRFLGASATEQTLLMEAFNPHVSPSLEDSSLPSSLAQASALWPFAPLHLPRETLAAQVAAQLPPFARATALYEAYFTNIAWAHAPIDRKQVVNELMPLFYRRRPPPTDHLHDLTLLLAVFACGAVGDLTQSPCNPEGERYRQLARAALSLTDLFHNGGSLAVMQTMTLFAVYEIYTAHGEGVSTAQEAAWKLISLGLTIASSIGLHRDPARWKLEPDIVQRRRRTFWELYVLDHWKSLGSGRPPVFTPSVVDCEFPTDDRATIGEDGTVILSVREWAYRFGRDVLPHLTEKLCAARPLRYSEIIELDRRVSDFDVHPHTRPTGTPGPDVTPEFHSLYPLITVWYKEMSLLFIHRNFFARAMLESPSDPLHSPFARSFLATYRSATVILAIVRVNYDRLYLVLLRVWGIWANALTSAIIVGSVVARGPTISFAPAAFVELELAITLFQKPTVHPIVKRCLPLLLRIRDKAQHALYKSRAPKSPRSENSCERKAEVNGTEAGAASDRMLVSRHGLGVPVIHRDADSDDDGDAELLILRGTTRVVEQRTTARTYVSSPSASSSPPSSEASPESSGTSGSGSASTASSEPPSGNLTVMSNARGWPNKGSHARTSLFANTNTACLLSASSLVEVPTATKAAGTSPGSTSSTRYEGAAQAHAEAHAYSHATSTSSPDAEMDMAQTWLTQLEQERAIAAQLASQAQISRQQQDPWQWQNTASMISAMQGPSAENPSTHPYFGSLSSGSASTSDRNAGLGVGFDHAHLSPQAPASANPASDPFMALPTSFASVVGRDDAAHYQSEGEIAEAASAEAWRVFVQQSGFLDPNPNFNPDISFAGWEGVAFS